MTPDWTPLDTELARWRNAGLVLPLWWRDDDAVAPTPALTRLSGLSRSLGVPVHLAVIPARADDTLAEALGDDLVPVVHGWSHTSHAPAGEKKAEFGPHRPVDTMRTEARDALARLRELFGARLVPMFVPPWNRITPDVLPRLPGLGYRMLSTFTPRDAVLAAPGLVRINTHLDPINWRAGKSLVDPDTLIAQVAQQLADRRLSTADNDEPYGILTHHLVHDKAIWDFTEQLLARLLAGPARCWTAPKEGPTE